MHNKKAEDTLNERQARYASGVLKESVTKLILEVEQLSLNRRISFKKALRKHMQFDDREMREADLKRLLRIGYEERLAHLYLRGRKNHTL